ncbi:mannose-1-phosphate guanylyltransferase/mannose-6-phosphate isomerase [Photobacterium atrarenae]|uniref:mannose-1-phosphate guanylyltransferase n=1 Tax=Photobacterium atrarenae TaxID=865757 RepID=A0ABY5GMI4_9GAMM|nr:mannose-1-phosphate guanylyltransferase/mannose-6-phosphate isomerase [Photobacterium atrarenae]UTV30467.1 mannose-1-phosphate guanylyltransferase/mannose-6-phosphate isomerase [Photobacterium atrarenae]
MLIPVILAGGSGTRLWPLSRAHYPKQFLSLTEEKTMLQATIARLADMDTGTPIILCNETNRFLVAEQLREYGQLGQIILEPVSRNTAPAIALAALAAQAEHSDPLLLVLAADHVIQDPLAFQQVLTAAIPAASSGKFVTFGIVPTCPHTGYGYIKQGKPLDDGYRVSQFVEKPDQATAQDYLNTGGYLWNSGMFMFRASRYLKELAQHRPAIYEVCQAAFQNSREDLDFIRIQNDIFSQCPDESIDYAVMEHTTDSVVFPLDAGWSDIGSWSSLWDIHPKDENGNAVIGDALLHESQNSLVYSEHRLIATIGLDNMVVVDTKDAILIARKDKVQDVKTVVEQLKAHGRAEFESHREVYRPWGNYDSIDHGGRYQVKHITVKPGAKLSLQMHHHRAEHWVVVSGTAKVTLGDQEILLSENQSSYIPLGVVHALENPGKIPLELIEIQSGPYLGEDDIVRFEDRYGRS